jgi:hypothetical protein
MLYRTIQRHLRRLKSTIALNQKKTILLQELARLNGQKHTEGISFIEVRTAKEIESFMLSTINNDVLCGSLGSDEYWQGLLTNPVDIIIQAIFEDTLVGFVLIRTNYECRPKGCTKNKSWNSFYIELICSTFKGGGVDLMNQVKQLARLEKRSTIHLSSVIDLVPYYAMKHQFVISRDCYPKMETEITHLFDLIQSIKQIQNRRVELVLLTKTTHTKQIRDTIKAERVQMNRRIGIMSRQKKVLIDKFRDVSTFQLKYMDRVATAENVVDDGVYMSFCVST